MNPSDPAPSRPGPSADAAEPRGVSFVPPYGATTELTDLDPDSIASYQMLARLDRGDWGHVFLGRSVSDVLVSIRLLDPAWMAPAAGRSILVPVLLAARRTAGMSSIVRVLDAGAGEGYPYIVSEYVDGRTLQDVVEQYGPLTGPELERTASDLLGALVALHDLGVAHRHLAPDSVLAGPEGVRLSDVGLSRLPGGLRASIDGDDFSWWYAAPEALRGEWAETAADMFAWGATVAFLASGQAPFAAPSPEDYLWRIDTGDAEFFGLSAPLLDVVRRCLAWDAQQRPTAAEARAELAEAARSGAPHQIAPFQGEPYQGQPLQSASWSVQPYPPAPPSRSAPPPFPLLERPAPSSDAPPVFVSASTPRTGPSAGPAVAARPADPQGGLRAAAGRLTWWGAARPGPDGGPGPDDGSARTAELGPPEDRSGSSRRRAGWVSRRVILLAVLLLALPLAAGAVVLGRHAASTPLNVLAADSAAPPPCQVPSTGTFADVVFNPVEGCYGYADSGAGFGRDPLSLQVQAAIFGQNRPIAPGDLTVIWLGPLTCPAYVAGGGCSDGRVYDSERQELQGLELAQLRTDLGGHVHVVVANAGPDFVDAVQVAQMIAAHRSSFGRAVVIGAGEGRVVTKQAIEILLAAGMPVIAPNFTADEGAPGQPALSEPNYLQLSPPNQDWANATVSLIERYSPPGGHRQVIVYHKATPGDTATQSIAEDVMSAAQAQRETSSPAPELIDNLAAIPSSVCRDAAPGTTPAALFFADKWTTFPGFVKQLMTLCGRDGPALLVGGDNVDRFMTNDAARSTLTAPWPMAYFRKGKQCTDLQQSAAQDPNGEAAELLAAAQSTLKMCSEGSGGVPVQIGDRVSEFWDSVALASKIIPENAVSGIVHDVTLNVAGGTLVVRGGSVVSRPGPSSALCVRTVDLSQSSGRSLANCDAAFGADAH